MNRYIMNRYSEKGYHVKENSPVYYTKNVDKTVKWFEAILGWYYNIAKRDERGNGRCGAVFEMVPDVELTYSAPLNGFQMYSGEPRKGLISFMQVKGIEQMHSYIISQGWKELTEIVPQPTGGKAFDLTTIDGCIIRVFEN